ncbi:MAG: hypothetical protein Q9174_007453, partial [Haloplaca sp. 1 TL-2023]
VSGKKAGSGKAVAPVSFKFTPNSLTAATMQKAQFGSSFSDLQSATVKILTSAPSVLVNVFLADTIEVVLHT